MKSIIIFVIGLLVFNIAFGQAQRNGVQVKILHQQHVVLDTIIYKQGNEAINSIEHIVSSYTDQPVYIDTDVVRELYVFSFEHIKKPRAQKKPEPVEINIDSILNKIAIQIEKVANDPKVNAVKDSIYQSMKEIKQAIEDIDKEDVKRAKDELKEFVEKVKETRVIIIQEGDTIKIPNKKKSTPCNKN